MLVCEKMFSPKEIKSAYLTDCRFRLCGVLRRPQCHSNRLEEAEKGIIKQEGTEKQLLEKEGI